MTAGARSSVNLGLIGAGRIGRSHAQLIAERVLGAVLAAVADPRPEAAEALAARFTARPFTHASELIGDGDVDAVVIAASSESAPTARSDVDLTRDAYTGEFIEFVAAVRDRREPYVTGRDARRALQVALACIDSFQQNAPVRLEQLAVRR